MSSVIGAAGGVITAFLGEIDQLIITLVTFMCLDYATGVIKAICEKKLSSAVGFKGIVKKFFIILIVGLTVSLERIMPAAVPLREMTVLFFVANEGFSILENVSMFIPLPGKLKSVLAQLQKDNKETGESEDVSNADDFQKDPLNKNK